MGIDLVEMKAMSEAWVKRTAALGLLVALGVAWPVAALAQGTGAVEYGRQTQIEYQKQQKLAKKTWKKQAKANKKYAKAQKKALKKANHHTKQ
jgi:hypothetical protein